MKRKVILTALIIVTGCGFLFSQTVTPTPYCVADFDDENGDVPDAVFNVSFGTLSNATNAQCPFPHYIFYNNLAPANFTTGNTYTLSLTFDVHGSAGYGVWIDYDHNSAFDASEKVAGSTGTNFLSLSMYPAYTIVTKTFAIPASALTGPTRMRVRIVEDDNYTGTNGASILACNTGTSSTDVMDWGETEDYTLNIIAPSVGIKEQQENRNVSIYPNPVSTSLMVDQNRGETLTYKVVDMTGRLMQTGIVNPSEKQIEVSSFSSGIYFLNLFNGNESIGQLKFMKTSE